MGDACIGELMRRRFSPDVCSCCVSRNASVCGTERAYRLGLAILKKLTTERASIALNCIVTFILNKSNLL